MQNKKNSGQDLYSRAKELIPGGGQLLSKRPDRFLPDLWPTYYKKAKGCEVWDLDGNRYYDFAQMGVGSCILGYADEDINAAVKEAIDLGSMCTLNSYEEVELAERLIDLHPWAQMARFSRAGGEACAIAVRIARAASGKDRVAFCGYHGWHDWYLSANLENEKSLDGQLLPGLEPRGVPRSLKGTALTFNFNKIEELEKLKTDYGHEIGVVYLEPARGQLPNKEFLQGVRKICDEMGAVLVFDEVTSGFRMNLGGIHLLTGVNPDIAVFGKALGNGYPISAVIGRASVMDAAQTSFISSTFWTERVGFVAANATIKKQKSLNVPANLVRFGEAIGNGWLDLAKKNGIPVTTYGIPPLVSLSFKIDEPLVAQTYYAQEMLARGYLLGSAAYATNAYTDEIIKGFLKNTDEVFEKLSGFLKTGNLKQQLKGRVIVPGFKRLN